MPRKLSVFALAAILSTGLTSIGLILPQPAKAVVTSVRELPDGSLEVTLHCRRIIGNLWEC